MPYVIVIFLLFAAILIFAWFYLQRAKARDAATTAGATVTDTAQQPETTTPATDEAT